MTCIFLFIERMTHNSIYKTKTMMTLDKDRRGETQNVHHNDLFDFQTHITKKKKSVACRKVVKIVPIKIIIALL